MSFDFNKLDDYKVALDDGLMIVTDDEFSDITLKKTGKMYTAVIENIWEDSSTIIKETDWETFKKKVADYLLGADTDEN